MKKAILLIIFTFLLSNFTFSQYNPQLDAKNGFLSFKFGDPKSKYKGKIKHASSNFYYYTAIQPNSLFDRNWDNLIFQFFEDKLGYIQVQFKSNNKYLYLSLLQNFEEIFGESITFQSSKLDENKEVYRNQWEGNNVSLALFMYAEDSNLAQDYYINIIIRNKTLIKASLLNQF